MAESVSDPSTPAAKARQRRRRLRIGTTPGGMVVISMTLALFTVVAFALLVYEAKALSDYLRTNLKFQVYLDRDLSQGRIDTLGQELSSLPFVNREGRHGPGVVFVPREEAARRFVAETGEDFTRFLGDNPLRDAYELRMVPDSVTVEGMARADARIRQIPGVFETHYIENLVRAVSQNLSRLLLVLGVFAIVLSSVAIVLISNTIRLALHAQRLLIRSMQLVGAHPWFIIRPFLGQAALRGLLAGLMASTLLFVCLRQLMAMLPEVEATLGLAGQALVIFAPPVLGMALGIGSSFLSLKRYLRQGLDDLAQ